VEVDARPLEIRGAKPRALLLLLLAQANQVVSVDRLVDALWEDAEPQRATATLQTHLSGLRRLFTTHGARLPIVTRSPGYVLETAADGLDAGVFERHLAEARNHLNRPDQKERHLRAALDQWRGPAFGEFADTVWARPFAVRLEEMRLQATENLCDIRLRLGESAELIAGLEDAVSETPLRERLWELLILALYRSGRQGDALRAYGRIRRELGEELGIEPNAALVLLERSILTQDPELDWKPLPNGPLVGHRISSEIRPEKLPLGETDHFVGRQSELDLLDACWQQSSRGNRRFIFLAGESGMGKTQLLAKLVEVVGDAGVLTYGRCDEDVTASYQPFVEILAQLVANSTESALRSHIDRYGSDLSRLVPELIRRVPDAVPPDLNIERERFSLLRAATGMIAESSRTVPLVLLLDDLQWASGPAISLLKHLLHSSESMNLLVVGAYRQTDIDRSHPLSELLQEIQRLPSVRCVQLHGLQEHEITELARRSATTSLDSALVSRIAAETNGNPLFVEELIRHFGAVAGSPNASEADDSWAHLPGGLVDAVARRLARLSPSANRALRVAAVVGDEFSFALLECIPDAADNSNELLDALEEAIDAKIVRETSRAAPGYAFSHSVIRRSVSSQLARARLCRIHGEIAEALENLPTRTELRLPTLAYHFCQAASLGSTEKAADYSLQAGYLDVEQLAFEQAIDRFEQGVEALEFAERPDLERRCDLRLAIAMAMGRLNDVAGSRRVAKLVIDDARLIGDGPHFARAVIAYTNFGVAGAPDPDAGALCTEALEGLGPDHPTLRAQVLSVLAFVRALTENEGVLADSIAEEAVEIARSTGDAEGLCFALAARSVTLWGSNQPDLRKEIATDLITAAHSRGDSGRAAEGHLLRGLAHLELGDLAGWSDDAEQVRMVAAESDYWFLRSMLSMWAGMHSLMNGEFATAEDAASKMLEHAGSDQNFLNSYAALLYFVRREQRRLEELQPLILEMIDLYPALPVFRAAAGVACLELGDRDGASGHLDVLAANKFSGLPRDFVWTTTLALTGELSAHVGDVATVKVLHELLMPHRQHLIVTAWGTACLGSVARILGVLSARLERCDEAVGYFEQAIELESKLYAPLLEVQTSTSFARALLHRGGLGDLARAADLLRTAKQTSEAHQMARLQHEMSFMDDVLGSSH
jgi:DNA-binding SARP family transcriptional activator/tetratricopeptide (TPR) repeat protein